MLRITIAALLFSVFCSAAQAQVQPSPIKRTPIGKIDVPGSNYEVITALVEIAPGFKAGRRDAHHLVNRTEQEVVYLEVGDRAERDMVHYPDDDIVAAISADGRWRFVHKDGRPYLL